MTVDDERLLQQLGKHVRDVAAQDAELSHLSDGTLDAAARVRLEQAAGSDARLAMKLAAHAPLPTGTAQQISASVLAALRAAPSGGGEALEGNDDDAVDETLDEAPVAQPGAKVLQLSAARKPPASSKLTLIVLPLCAAAAACFLILRPAQHAQTAPLPSYELSAEAQLAETRGGAVGGGAIDGTVARDAALILDPKLGAKLTLRPATAVRVPMSAKVFVVQGAAATEWPAQVVSSETGSLQLQLAPFTAALAPAARAVVLIAPSDALNANAQHWAQDDNDNDNAGNNHVRLGFRLRRAP